MAASKLSKELVERAAAGRHQDVDRLLKEGAETWTQAVHMDIVVTGAPLWFLQRYSWTEASHVMRFMSHVACLALEAPRWEANTNRI